MPSLVMAGDFSWSPLAAASSSNCALPLAEVEEEGNLIWFNLDSNEHNLFAKKVCSNGQSFEPTYSEPISPTMDASKTFQKTEGFSKEFLRQLAKMAEDLYPEAVPSSASRDSDNQDGDNLEEARDAQEKYQDMNKYTDFLNSQFERAKPEPRQTRTKELDISANLDDGPLEKFSKYQARSTSRNYTDFRLEEQPKNRRGGGGHNRRGNQGGGRGDSQNNLGDSRSHASQGARPKTSRQTPSRNNPKKISKFT